MGGDDAGEGRVSLYVVAVQISKREANMTAHSMSMSYRVGGTREAAIGAAMEWILTKKPGFSVDDYLVSEFLVTDPEDLTSPTPGPQGDV